MEIFIRSEKVKLKEKGGEMYLVKTEGKQPFHPDRVERIWLRPDTQVDGRFLAKALSYGIDMVIMSRSGTPMGSLTPWANDRGGAARKRQALFSIGQEAQLLAASWILEKHKGQFAILEPFMGKYDITKEVGVMEDILSQNQGMYDASDIIVQDMQEAYFARTYFAALRQIIPPSYISGTRSRMPALDPFNAALNYAYGILYGLTEGAVRKAGLDPYVGFHHKERDGSPVLVFDVIEAYRHYADRVVVRLIHTGELHPLDDFDDMRLEDKGVILNDRGKPKLIHALMEMLETPNQEGSSPKGSLFGRMRELCHLISQFEIR